MLIAAWRSRPGGDSSAMSFVGFPRGILKPVAGVWRFLSRDSILPAGVRSIPEWLLLRLDGKIAFMTGAGSGIGEEIARLFAAQGASCVIADVDEESGRKFADEL